VPEEPTTLTAPPDLLAQLRAMVPPNRSLTYGQALVLADRQALRARRLLTSKTAALDFSWLFDSGDITVELRPEYKMPDHVSGITTKINGELVIFLNGNDGYPRQRFTLAHEFKHALDFDIVDSNYAKLGRGNTQLHDEQIERICNRFAAALLMPKAWVNRLWSRGITDPMALAGLFQVSTEAMTIRLEQLGYLGFTSRPHPKFFRHITTALSTSVAVYEMTDEQDCCEVA
jgi:Zn-dependent peptidase ImmA (M78 family)